MVAINIDGVRKAFDQDKDLGSEFARAFISAYAGTAFGVLSKSEIDLLVFSLLVQAKVIDANGSIYRIARALNVTPAKARSLLFQQQLRHMTEDDTDHAVMITLTTAKYRKDSANLTFGVASPLVQAAIRGKMQDGGVFADVSLSGDILKVSPEQFGAVISTLLSSADATRLVNHLKSKKLVDEKGVRKAIGELGTMLAKEAVEKGSEKGLEQLLEGLKGLVEDHADHAIDIVAGLLS